MAFLGAADSLSDIRIGIEMIPIVAWDIIREKSARGAIPILPANRMLSSDSDGDYAVIDLATGRWTVSYDECIFGESISSMNEELIDSLRFQGKSIIEEIDAFITRMDGEVTGVLRKNSMIGFTEKALRLACASDRPLFEIRSFISMAGRFGDSQDPDHFWITDPGAEDI